MEEVVAPPSHATANFQKALDAVVPACLVLKVTQTRSFDTESAGSAYATGFIVDAKRGLILTNRHVVTPGPITAEAIFLNREELPVRPLYYDPVHDFGFLRFDPSKVQFMPVTEVPLKPEGASVGMEVRVVGNDSGEKISILAGTLARLDRDAPFYSKKGYNDFNTFYLQAASGTKGGSSGSPVINSHGQVIALNAGGKNKAASAFYLPLDRVVRALKLLQARTSLPCPPQHLGPDEWRAPCIPRGDLQATFVFKGFDEVRRLGLTHTTEAAVRAAIKQQTSSNGVTGMLVVESVVPGGPADGVLEPGDVLVRLQGQVVVHFLPLETLLDERVGGSVTVEVERGGRLVSAELAVQDLHAVSPSSFLESAGGVLHGLSYQQARNNSAHVGQVYVAEPGYMLSRASVPKQAIITQLAGVRTPDLESFARQLASLAHGAQVPLQYFVFGERHHRRTAILHIDRSWHGVPQYWTRDDARGTWDRTEAWPPAVPAALPAAKPPLAPASDSCSGEGDNIDEDMLLEVRHAPQVPAAVEESQAERVRQSLVMLDIHLPAIALPDGVHCRAFVGNGVIVHHSDKLGLVVTDRNTASVSVGDVRMSFGAHPAEVEGRIRFLHPLHNFAILSYNPADLPPEVRVLALSCPRVPRASESTHVAAGLNKSMRSMARNSTVINACFPLSIQPIEVPRYRAVNEEVVKLDQDFGSAFSGVLVDAGDRLRALWASYSEQVNSEDRELCAGLPAAVIAPFVRRIAAAEAKLPAPCASVCQALAVPEVRVLDVELEPVLLSKAAQLGLPEPWVARLARLDPQRRQVLRVRSCMASSAARAVLLDGDLLLSVAGRPVSHFRAVEAAVAASFPAAQASVKISPSPVALKVCREGKVVSVQVPLAREDGLGTARIVHWAGAQLQAPHRAVREGGFLPACSGVFISRWHHGSPSHRYGLYALQFVQEVNGVPTPDLDAFVAAVSKLEDGAFVRVKLVHQETMKSKVLSLKQDLKYWPTWQLALDPATSSWTRSSISAVQP
ncbi:DegP-type protease [Coccomyxa subellipsoidea C-169]|uniref:DegP-type protease n=1 Tax=Coccomyxa subellipsoidea (strain C-169) TaxID=574566 RepID=I0Z1V5_COCSC|nr:DegP-type protease [Coccomyxa subellipsoidea C-169]EIE24624.1 DegP-type protease [Coccomyxa subellipsoidea C-169]|eukprot:XP_005649168.1 DegP-type protease [Coccomyxa subellipsoidea C-169]